MNQNKFHLNSAQVVALYSGIILVLLWAMHLRMGPELLDDGAFFLRYAENAANGEFWVWNPGEAPVWGASAPFYPLLIAIPIKLGISPFVAIVATGLILASVSFAAMALMMGQRFGVVAGLAFVTFLSLDSNVMWLSVSGLETPLTLALIIAGIWSLWRRPHAAVTGLIAGLLMINKLDLLPVGGLLLIAHWVQDRRVPVIACVVAAALTVGWYGFAYWYFGAPVPNSFLTKALHQNDFPKSIDWSWFSQLVLWVGVHKWLVPLSACAIFLSGRELRPLAFFLGGTLAVHLIAYTIKYPFEPYNWYAMPAVFALIVGASIGAGAIAEFLKSRLPGALRASYLVAGLLLVVITLSSLEAERRLTEGMTLFTSHQELDRAEAGRWVDQNTPQDFVVLTYWGNPAYFSRRKVIDGAFLNRRYEGVNLVATYRPEIVILQNNPGSPPWAPVFGAFDGGGYEVVKVFDKTYRAGMDYFFVVLAREDVVDEVLNADPPIDLMSFVHDIAPGDVFGTVEPRGTDVFFVHPGETTETAFSFATADYLTAVRSCSLLIHARIAANIPDAAVERGGGNVRLSILQGEMELANSVVSMGEPLRLKLPCSDSHPFRFVVDNNGSPDADWLLISIE